MITTVYNTTSPIPNEKAPTLTAQATIKARRPAQRSAVLTPEPRNVALCTLQIHSARSLTDMVAETSEDEEALV